jgi:hypothetical protein
MDHLGSVSADVEAWTLVNYPEEGGFPSLLWDTLKTLGTLLTQITRHVRS